MNKVVRRILKVVGGLIGLLIVGIAIFVAANFTLVKNWPSSKDGGFDAMYIANQKPLQRVQGGDGNILNVSPVSDNKFNAAHENWEQTGGKALLIWHKGEIIHEAYADGVSPTDRSRSFSMHKSILGLIAATMEADGFIDLDDPVSDYVEAYKKHGREAVTIRDLLTHKSGLERYPFTPPSLDTLNLLLSDKVEKAALKARIVDSDPVFDYTNIGYQVAGAAIRAALKQKTSQSYAEYLSARIWAPAGAQDAFLWSETAEGAPRFYAGLQASPRDWLKIGIMIAQNDGSVIPQAAINHVLKPSEPNAAYGLGIWLGSPEDGFREYGPSTAMKIPSAAPFAVPDTVFFDGFGGQRVYISQQEQLVIVRIGDVKFNWDDTALPNLVSTALGLNTSYVEEDVTLKAASERDVNVRMISQDLSCSDCKLAILSHGAFASDADYDAIALPLVNLGYRVAIPTHPDSKSHPLNESFDPKKYAAYRFEDHHLILEHVAKTQGEDTPWIAVGHSFGALIAANFAGATTDQSLTRQSALGLPRHAVVLSPPGAISFGSQDEAMKALKSSTLLVTGTNDLVPTMIDDWEDHLALYKAAPKGQVVALVFDDHDHYFNGLYGRRVEREHTQADDDLTAAMTAFLSEGEIQEAATYRILR